VIFLSGPEAVKNRVIWYIGHPGQQAIREGPEQRVNSEKLQKLAHKKRT